MTIESLKLSQKSRPTAPLCLKREVPNGPWMLSFSCLSAYFHVRFLKFSPFRSDLAERPGVCQALERHLTHKQLSSFHGLAFWTIYGVTFPFILGDAAFLPGVISGVQAASVCRLQGQRGDEHRGQLACSFPTSPRDNFSVLLRRGINPSLTRWVSVTPPVSKHSQFPSNCRPWQPNLRPAGGPTDTAPLNASAD